MPFSVILFFIILVAYSTSPVLALPLNEKKMLPVMEVKARISDSKNNDSDSVSEINPDTIKIEKKIPLIIHHKKQSDLLTSTSRNEWGVQGQSLFSARDLSLERPTILTKRKDEKKFLASFLLGEKRHAQILANSFWGKTEYSLKLGLSEDHTHLYFIDSGGNQWQEGGDFKNYITPEKNVIFSELHLALPQNILFKSAFDRVSENIFVLQNLAGKNKLKKEELDLFWQGRHFSLGGYGFFHQEEFRPENISQLKNVGESKSDSRHLGVKVKYQNNFGEIGLDASSFQGQRLSQYLEKTQFHRNLLEFQLEVKKEFQKFLVSNKGQIHFIQDSLNPKKFALTQKKMAWSEELELKGNFLRSFYWDVLGQYYARAPSVLMVFGDGQIHLGSFDLPLENGSKISSSFKFQNKFNWGEMDFGPSISLEKTKNTPYWQGITPTSGKYFPLAGTWVREVKVEGLGKYFWGESSLEYKNQKALSDSQIDWQKGKILPLHPVHTWKISQKFIWKNISLKMLGSYQSFCFLDLANLIEFPRSFHSDLIFSLEQKNWAITISAKNILARPLWQNVPSSQSMTSSVHPELFDTSTHYLFNWEFYL